MEEWIQLVLFIIFGAVALLARLFSRRNSRAEPDIAQEEEEITLPPWGNLPMEEEDCPHPDLIDPSNTCPPHLEPVAPQHSSCFKTDTQSQGHPRKPYRVNLPLVLRCRQFWESRCLPRLFDKGLSLPKFCVLPNRSVNLVSSIRYNTIGSFSFLFWLMPRCL